MTIHFRCITRCSFGASEPHVSGASDVNGHELLHRVHPLLPQFHEFGAAHGSFGRPHLRQLAVDDGDAIFQRGRERRRAAARDPRGGVVALELRLERRGLLLHPLQLSGVDTPARARPDQEQQRDARRRRQAPRSPPAPASCPAAPPATSTSSPPCPSPPRTPPACSPRRRAATPPTVTSRSTARRHVPGRSGLARQPPSPTACAPAPRTLLAAPSTPR